MAVAVPVERRALREGLPPLGKLTMWLWAWGLMMLLTLAFILVPYIPGLRSLPRVLGVHRLIWRNWSRGR